MSHDMEVTLRLNADGRAMIVQTQKASKALDGLGNNAENTGKRLTKTAKGVESISAQLARTKSQLLGFFGFTALTSQMAGLVRDMTDVAQATESWQSRLTVAMGSASAAASEIDWVREKAKSLSLDMRTAADGYSQFATAAKLAGMDLEAVRGTFEGVARASAAMKLSSEKQNQALTALSQMASKGVVSMEELRQQLGEAIPGATSLAAQAMGMTTAEFNKAVSSGEVLASDLLPKLGEELKKTFESVEPTGYTASMNRLKNAWFEFLETLGNSGAMDLVVKALEGVTSALTTLTPMIGGVVSAFEPLMVILGSWAAYTYLPILITRIAAATREWIAAQIALNTAQAGGGLRAFISNLSIAKGSISGTVSALSSLKGAVGVASAAFAGWQIGKWAYENFAVVRSVGYEVVVTLVDYWDGFVTWIAQAFNGIKSVWTSIMGAIYKRAKAVSLGISAAWSMIVGGFAKMGVNLLTLAKTVIEKIGSGFKGLFASISGLMAGALTKIRNGLSGLGNIETPFGNIDLIPDSVVSALDSKIKILNEKAGDTTYKFTGLNAAIGNLSSTAKASVDNIAAAGKAHQDYANTVDGEVNAAIANLVNKNAALAKIRAKNHDYNMRDIADYQNLVEVGGAVAKAQAGLVEQYKQTQQTATDTATALSGAGIKASGAGKKMQGAGTRAKTLKNSLNGVAETAKQVARELAQFDDKLGGLLGSLFPASKLMNDMQSDAKMLARALTGDGVKAMKKYGVSTDEVGEKLSELQSIITGLESGNLTTSQAKSQFDDMKKGIEAVKEESKRTANVMTEQFKRAVESIDQSFANMWKSILSGGKVSFKSLADSAKNIMAEILHSVTTKPLTQAIMDSVTGEITTNDGDKKTSPANGIIHSLNDGFGKLEKSFTKGLKDLLGMEAATAQTFGRVLAGGALGAGLGGGIAGAMGAENANHVGLVSGLAGSLATAAVSAWGAGASATMAGTLAGLSATGVGAIVAAVAAVVMTVVGKKEDPTSRAWVRADGTVSHTRDNKIDGNITRSAGLKFWEGAKSVANIYGVEFADELTASLTYKQEKKGGLKYYFDLFNDANLDGKRDGQLFYHAALSGDDANDPKKIALAMAQMQVAALAQADWSPVSKTIAHGMTGVSPENMSMDDVGRFNHWLDQTLLVEKAYGGMLDGFTSSLTHFGGSFHDFLDYTQAVYSLVGREGQQLVDAMMKVFKNNTDFDWSKVARSVNVLTQGMDLLGQTTDNNNYRLVSYSQGIVDAMGGVEAATQTYMTIFNATATQTHKAGIAYQNARGQLDLLNMSMGLSGAAMINTREQLREYVAGLDPLSKGYAENMRWAAKVAESLTATTAAAKFFDDAIAGIQATIGSTVQNIREDLMSEEELYNTRKNQAETLAKSIAEMTDVGDIEKAVGEANSLVTSMWRSLGSEAKNAINGEWMIQFLNEMETLASNRVADLQNAYGAQNALNEEYQRLKALATATQEDQDDAVVGMAETAEALHRVVVNEMASSASKQSEAADTMSSAASVISRASSALENAADSVYQAARAIPSTIRADVNVDVDVNEREVA